MLGKIAVRKGKSMAYGLTIGGLPMFLLLLGIGLGFLLPGFLLHVRSYVVVALATLIWALLFILAGSICGLLSYRLISLTDAQVLRNIEQMTSRVDALEARFSGSHSTLPPPRQLSQKD